MSDTAPQPSWFARWRWQVWWLFALLWTAALVAPIPSGDDWELDPERRITLRMLISKTAHVAGYAVFTVLGGWLRAPLRYRWLLMFFLMAHASVTELIQALGGYRTGTLRDVLLDHLGIGLGLLYSWRGWAAADGEMPRA